MDDVSTFAEDYKIRTLDMDFLEDQTQGLFTR